MRWSMATNWMSRSLLTRDDGETTLLVVANFTKETIKREYAAGQGKLLLSNYENVMGETLRPYEAKVYEFSSKR